MMPIASIITIAIILRIVFSNKEIKIKYINLLTLAVLFSILSPQGYLIKIGDLEISSIKKMCGLACCLISIYMLIFKRHVHSFKILKNTSLLIGSIIIGIFIQLAFPYEGLVMGGGDGYSWDGYILGECNREILELDLAQTGRLFMGMCMFVIITINAKYTLKKEDLIVLIDRIIFWSRFAVIYGAFEFIEKNIIGNTTLTFEINDFVFGTGVSTFQHAFLKGGDYYVLQGITREPSHFITSLFFITIFLTIKLKTKDDCEKLRRVLLYLEIIFVQLMMFLSGGFTFFACLMFEIVYFLYIRFSIYKIELTKIIRVFVYAILLMLIIAFGVVYIYYDDLQYYISRFNDAIDVFYVLLDGGIPILTMEEGMLSTISRLTSIFYVIQDALNRPLFGLGLGMEFALDNTATMFSDLGIMGIIFWFRFLMTKVDKNLSYDSSLLFMLLCWGVFCGNSITYVEYYLPILVELSCLYYPTNSVYNESFDKGSSINI